MKELMEKNLGFLAPKASSAGGSRSGESRPSGPKTAKADGMAVSRKDMRSRRRVGT